MILESICLSLLLIIVIVRLYTNNKLVYMRENRIYDDNKRKKLKITFIMADIMLFIIVILYLFMKGFLSGIL